MKVYTLQIKVIAVIEQTIPANSLEEAAVHAKSLEWDDVLPGYTIVEGSHRIVGVFQNWDTQVY